MGQSFVLPSTTPFNKAISSESESKAEEDDNFTTFKKRAMNFKLSKVLDDFKR